MSQVDIAKEIAFWKLQIEEHMLFIYQGLVDDFAGNKLKEETVKLHQLWCKVSDDVVPLIEETLIFQYLLLAKLKHGCWIGWLSVSFIKHLIKETKYFKSKILGQLTKQDEIKFWLWHHHSEFEGMEKLLDPSEEELCFLVKDYINYVKKLESDFKYKNNSKEIQEILDEYLDH